MMTTTQVLLILKNGWTLDWSGRSVEICHEGLSLATVSPESIEALEAVPTEVMIAALEHMKKCLGE